ncbi:hypothetical protein [Streptomyces sp. NPDC096152]|uniref:hypothetical protein n=1 Tax=Streptomyces sp. NPDC096152 TaxID=3366078 RepID=UPI00381DAD37
MRKRLLSTTVAGAAAGVLALGACSGNPEPAPTTQPPTTTATTPASPTSPASPSSPAATPSATASGPVPAYPGATVTTHTDGFTLLHSDDSVRKVGAFYVDTLAREGWRTISKYQGEFSVNVVAQRADEGVTVQVSPTGSGTSISITTYPR